MLKKVLGLDKASGDKLFLPWDNGNYDPMTMELTPKNCAKVIRHLINTGIVDWSIIKEPSE
jgi:hypothetical protein